MLERKIEKELRDYYEKGKNILIVDGARQVGKSFIIRKTASEYFKNYIEINLKDDFDGEQVFSKVKTTDDFYLRIGSKYGDKLGTKEDTIIFLDEIQVYPHLISMLKALKQEGKYRFICSGSQLGITLKHTFIPMGAIEEKKMYPLDFEEFLLNSGMGETIINYLKTCFINRTTINENVHDEVMRRFKKYLITGGLPSVVDDFLANSNIYKTRDIQNGIISYYKDDASQYDIEHSLKIRRIYDLMPSFMENKVKRFIYKDIEGKNYKFYDSYQDEFDYLVSSGCAIKVYATNNIKFPLLESMSKNLIKLYFNDVGLLSALLYRNNSDEILFGNNELNLGNLYETFAAQELNSHGVQLFYFDSKKNGEVDFLISNFDTLSVLPIEIKSGKNFDNYRAIPKLVKEPYSLKEGFIFANTNKIEIKNSLVTYPIYMIMFIKG